MDVQSNYILHFEDVSNADIAKVGGKNASLGEMIQNLTNFGLKVPTGFALTTTAFQEYLHANRLDEIIKKNFRDLNIKNLESLQKCSVNLKNAFLEGMMPKTIEEQVLDYYQTFVTHNPIPSVAVRSSATAEDLADASFAGQQDTYLNVIGKENLIHAIKAVYASLFSERAISYRQSRGFKEHEVAISVGIQQMIRSDLSASGVLFTMDTESGFDKVIFITASYGLGETIVQGKVNPDEFYLYKPKLREGKPAILSHKLGNKSVKMIYAPDDSEHSLQIVDVPEHERSRFCINDEDLLKLGRCALLIEEHYQKAMDVEWGKDGIDGEIYILQARPETVKRAESHLVLEQYYMREKSQVITTGRSVGQRIGRGAARLISSPKEMHLMEKNKILVTNMTDPDWEPIMKEASAIVTNRGGRTCHAAIIARELGIPAVVGCGDATDKIRDGEAITVSCAEGETGYVYQGELKFEVRKTELSKMPSLPIQICMNLGNPEQAFHDQFIPNDGVGLTRIEFIISDQIGIHPNACLQFSKLDKKLQTEILARTSTDDSPIEFYVRKLSEGIAMIAAAFYPKQIIVRFSDFKSNEYANLLGGYLYEPKEENPMLGYRGAARYLSADFSESFALECRALKHVRETLGLTNAHVMFPFVRTVDEARELLSLLKTNGLARGENGLKVYLMCEIPSNVLLAEEFLQHVDGFSIGSNDLTQLTLGLDRDSNLVADVFDERNPAVLSLLRQAIATCKRLGKYIGICGQGPSDHTDFALWLMNEGITSISLSPDSIISTWLALGEKGGK